MDQVSGTAAAEPTGRCPNCDTPVTGRYCAACGQDQTHDLRRSLRRFLGEVIEETVALDSRIVHTVPPLLFRPGNVAADMSAGRRARYSSPLRLYLVASLLFFLASAVGPKSAAAQLGVGPGSEPDEEELTMAAAAGDVADGPAPSAGGTAVAGAQRGHWITRLRDTGSLGALLADHAERLRGLPAGEAQRRYGAAFADHAPTAFFLLVPILAALLKLAFWRRYYAEHLVLALHAQTVAFLALLPGVLSNLDWLAGAGLLATVLWLWLALRRIHGQGVTRTTLRLVGVGFAYMLSLGVVLLGAAVVALLAV